MGQSVDHAVGRSRRVFAKSETTFGTFVKPVATDAIKTIGAVKMEPSQERKFRGDNRNSRGRGTEMIDGKIPPVPWSLETYLLPSGSAGVAPDVGELLKRALGTETVTGGTKVDYTLSGIQALGSLSIEQWLHDGAASPQGVLMEAIFGAWVEQLTIKISGTEEPRLLFEGAAAKYAGTAFGTTTGTVTAPATTFTLAAADAGALQVGSVIKIGTDDNAGAGYEVTAVDSAGTGITYTPALGVTQTGATPIRPFAPSETTAGSPLGVTLGSLTVDAVALPVIAFELVSKNNNKAMDEEVGQTNATDYIPGEREVSGSITYKGRRDNLIYWMQRWRTATRDLLVTVGNTAGKRLKVNVDFAKFNFDALEIPEKEEVVVALPFDALESAGNDEFNLSFD